jgi:hypothetical protein
VLEVSEKPSRKHEGVTSVSPYLDIIGDEATLQMAFIKVMQGMLKG